MIDDSRILRLISNKINLSYRLQTEPFSMLMDFGVFKWLRNVTINSEGDNILPCVFRDLFYRVVSIFMAF